MRAILINPTMKSVEEVELKINPDDSGKEVYSLLSKDAKFAVDCFAIPAIALLPNGETLNMFVDDEGHLKPGNPTFTLAFDERKYPYAGNALVIEMTEDGSCKSLGFSLEKIKTSVVFSTKVSSGDFTPSTEGYSDHPVLGRVWTLTGGQPILKEEVQ